MLRVCVAGQKTKQQMTGYSSSVRSTVWIAFVWLLAVALPHNSCKKLIEQNSGEEGALLTCLRDVYHFALLGCRL